MQILQFTVALCQQVSNVLGKPQKQKLRQDFDFTAGKETPVRKRLNSHCALAVRRHPLPEWNGLQRSSFPSSVVML